MKTKTKVPIAILLTDTHLSESNIEVNKSVFKQAREIAIDNGLRVIFHMGDIFQSRKGQSQAVLAAFEEILDEFEEDVVRIYTVPGNHDKTDYASEKSFLGAFRHHPAFVLNDEYFETMIQSGIILAMMPFFADEQYIETFNKYDHTRVRDQKHVLLTHIGMNGAMMNNGIKVSSGITEELFKNYDKVLIGHYHDASSYSDKIKYIGSSIQHNFGETPAKGLTVLYDDLSTETIELEFPRYKTFEINVTEVTNKDIADLKQEKIDSGDFIRVVLLGEEKDLKSFDKVKLEAAGIKVATKQEAIDQVELENKLEAFTDKTLQDEFIAFCKKNKLDKEAGLKYLNKIL